MPRSPSALRRRVALSDATYVVEMADEADRLWLAIYRMQRQPDNTWRIDGCVLKRVDGTRSELERLPKEMRPSVLSYE